MATSCDDAVAETAVVSARFLVNGYRGTDSGVLDGGSGRDGGERVHCLVGRADRAWKDEKALMDFG